MSAFFPKGPPVGVPGMLMFHPRAPKAGASRWSSLPIVIDLFCLMVASARMMFAESFVWLAEPARSFAPHLDGAYFSSIGLSDTGPFSVCATAKPASAATATSNTTRTTLTTRACLIGRLLWVETVWSESRLLRLSIAERAIALGRCRIASRHRPVAATARRAHQHDVAALEHVLAAVVDRDAVDLHVTEAAVAAARESWRGELRALGHERGDDWHVRLALEHDVLSEPAAKPAGAARARGQPLLAEEERAVALGHLDRRRRDVARPGEHVLAVLAGRRAHAAVEEENVGVGAAIGAESCLLHGPEGRAGACHHAIRDHLMERAEEQHGHVVPGDGTAHDGRREARIEERALGRGD